MVTGEGSTEAVMIGFTSWLMVTWLICIRL